jgi:hypothetical protein
VGVAVAFAVAVAVALAVADEEVVGEAPPPETTCGQLAALGAEATTITQALLKEPVPPLA